MLIREKAVRMLELVGLSHRENIAQVSSGGEQQRVTIARALLMQPSILLADEPTGNLDQKTGQQIQDLLMSLSSELGMTMLLVTHDMQLANKLNYQIIVEDGSIVDRGYN